MSSTTVADARSGSKLPLVPAGPDGAGPWQGEAQGVRRHRRWYVHAAGLPGICAAARSLPLDTRTGLSGDWFDVRPVAGDVTALVVGDVMGSGPAAAALAEELRALTRTLLVDRCHPSLLPGCLDAVVGARGRIATLVCALVDRRCAEAQVVSAGHFPLLAINGGRAEYLRHRCRPPLGAPCTGLAPVTRVAVTPGTTVVGFTDGLVERRRSDLGQGLERLRRAAERLQRLDPDALCDGLVSALLGGRPAEDDVTVLAVRVGPRT